MQNVPVPPLSSTSPGEPRRWVELAPVPCRHHEASRGMILRAAEAASPGKAVVLGAGRCEEIPLAELAGRFSEVTLNDVDGSLLDRAAPLVADEAGKIRRHVADLTGVTDEFLQSVDGCLEIAVNPELAIEWIAGIAGGIQPRTFATGARYDLIVASCVLCQLHLGACNGTIARFAARFPEHERQFRESPRWFQAMYGLARRMEAVFVDSLHGLVVPGGRIYLSETIQGCFLHPTPQGAWLTDGMHRMTHTTQLRDYLDARFRVEQQGKWTWVVLPDLAASKTGRLYNVQALILSV